MVAATTSVFLFMQALKRIAESGVAVIAVVHQPRPEVR